MGYALTKILVYGVEVSEEIAEKIREQAFDEGGDFTLIADGDVNYKRPLGKRGDKRGWNNTSVEIKSAAHDDGGSDVFDPRLFSDGTDSRIECLMFEPGRDHVFGVYVGSKGYAYEDDLKALKANLPKEVPEQYQKYIVPLLKKLGADVEPELLYVTQTW